MSIAGAWSCLDADMTGLPVHHHSLTLSLSLDRPISNTEYLTCTPLTMVLLVTVNDLAVSTDIQ